MFVTLFSRSFTRIPRGWVRFGVVNGVGVGTIIIKFRPGLWNARRPRARTVNRRRAIYVENIEKENVDNAFFFHARRARRDGL